MISGAMLDIEGGAAAGADVGYEPSDRSYGVIAEGDGGGGRFFHTADGKAAFAIWAGAVVWLVLVWRAVEGY